MMIECMVFVFLLSLLIPMGAWVYGCSASETPDRSRREAWGGKVGAGLRIAQSPDTRKTTRAYTRRVQDSIGRKDCGGCIQKACSRLSSKNSAFSSFTSTSNWLRDGRSAMLALDATYSHHMSARIVAFMQ